MSTRPPSVLAVDDDPELLWMLELCLRASGWRVRCAVDGGDAVRLHRPGAFDCVLLDVQMPRLDGDATLRALRAVEPTLPVVLMSGRPLPTALAALVRARRCGFLRKPFDAPSAVAALWDARDERRLRGAS